MPRLLENKCAFITGATRGIGLAIAEAFAREGAEVIAGCRDVDDVTIGEPFVCDPVLQRWIPLESAGCKAAILLHDGIAGKLWDPASPPFIDSRLFARPWSLTTNPAR